MVNATQHLIHRHRIGEVVILIAIRARQVASPHRHDMRHIRVPGRHHRRPDRTKFTQLARHCLPAAFCRHGTSAAHTGSCRSRRHITSKYNEPARISLFSPAYLPTTRIENVSGTICPLAGRPPGGGEGAGVNSAVISSSRFVLLSSVSVFARGIVCNVCSTTKLVGLFSFTIVNVPSPCELN